MVANILLADPYPQALGMGSIGQNSTFSEHGHVAYQIKENHECSNTLADILPTDLPLPWGLVHRSKSHFAEHGHVAYQINGNHGLQQHGSKCFARRPSPTTLEDGVKRPNIQLFQNMIMLHIKLKGIAKCSNARRPSPTTLGDGVKRPNIQLFQNMVMMYIKLKGIKKCSNRVANVLPADPPPLPEGMGSKINFIRKWSCCISN